jgi:hypothetical protein
MGVRKIIYFFPFLSNDMNRPAIQGDQAREKTLDAARVTKE